MTEATYPVTRYVVYLLHIHDGMAGSHYVGITTPPRLAERMREHAAGRGSRATAAACRCNRHWYLGEVFATDDWLDEARIANHPAVHLWCRVCQSGQAIKRYQPTKMAASEAWRPSVFEEHLGFGATHAGPFSNVKKGKLRWRPPLLHFFGQP